MKKQCLFLDKFATKNEVIALDDTGSIMQFNGLTKIKDIDIDGNKISCSMFGDKYAIVKSKAPNGCSFTIYDIENHLIAFSSMYANVLRYFCRGEQLIILVSNSKGEKQIIKFWFVVKFLLIYLFY